MSYILEALRQSQAEREQGRRSALEAGARPPAASGALPRNRWGQVAALLAGVALLVALYAAVRPSLDPGPGGVKPPAAAMPVAAAPPAAERSGAQVPGQVAAAALGASGRPRPGGAAVGSAPGWEGGEAPAAAGLPRPPAPPPAPSQPLVAVGSGPGADAPPVSPVRPPLVEPPPLRGQPARQGPPPGSEGPPPREALLPRPVAPAPVAAPAPGGGLSPEDAAAAALEEELARRAVSDAPVELDPEAPIPAGPTPIPPDLVASIDAFKREVAGRGPGPGREKAKDQGADQTKGGAARGTPAVPMPPPLPVPARPPAGAAPAAPSSDPTRLRLTREQEAALPPFRLTVHVFDADPGRRFVLINGQKYGEGSKTREGLTIETIRVDGAVLVHDGHPFFVHR